MNRKTPAELDGIWNRTLGAIVIIGIAIVDWHMGVFIAGVMAAFYLIFYGKYVLAWVWNFIADRVENKHMNEND